MNKRWDILGLGCATVDDTFYVDSFPAADTKSPVIEYRRRCGGLTATALMAAARLGARCAYAGVLGHDDLSHFVEGAMQQVGVDTAQVVRRDDAQPIHATVVVGQADHTRTIFYHVNGRSGADDDLPAADVIRAARVLFMDTYGMTGNLRAARIARTARIPIVADFEHSDVPHFHELLALVDHLIVSERFALSLTHTDHPAEAARSLFVVGREVVVVTCGSDGCWVTSGPGESRHQPAYPVEVVDTTGCGDVFHGAYALALAQGRPLPDRIRFASAAAALKATQPGIEGVPRQDDVAAWLAQRG